jgi:hypothetical protein
MKRPWLDEWQRRMILMDTDVGRRLALALSWAKFKRELYRAIKK